MYIKRHTKSVTVTQAEVINQLREELDLREYDDFDWAGMTFDEANERIRVMESVLEAEKGGVIV